MAEALARSAIAEHNLDWTVSSAGLHAFPGLPMSEPSKQALLRRAVPIGLHRSKPVTEEIVADATIILAMTSSHARELRERFPEFAQKVHELGEFLRRANHESGVRCDIVDPFGGSDEQYEVCAKTLEDAVNRLINRLVEGTV